MATTDLIDVGSAANDDTGDTLRAGGQAINTILRKGSAGTPYEVRVFEDPTTGTNYVSLVCPTGIAASYAVTLPEGNLDLETIRQLGAVPASSGVSASIELLEDTDNGTDAAIITAPASMAADRTTTLPSGGNLDLETIRQLGAVPASSGVSASIELLEDTDNGTDAAIITAPASMAADRTTTLPSGGDLDLETIRQLGAVPASSGVPASVLLLEDSDNGTNYVKITSPAGDILANRTLTLPFGGDLDLEVLRKFTLVAAASGTVSSLRVYEDTDSGTNYCLIAAPTALGGDRTLTLPDADLDLDDVAAFALTQAASGTVASLKVYEDTDNGTNYCAIAAPSALGGDRTLTLPDADLDLSDVADFGFSAASASGPATCTFKEDTDNGANYVTVTAPSALGGNRTLTLPDADLDLGSLNTRSQANTDYRYLAEVVSVGAAHGDTVAVSFKCVDGDGDDVGEVTSFRWWLSSDATTGALHGTTPDGGITWTTGVGVDETTADLAGFGVTDSNGDATISVNHAADAQDYYLWVQIGDRVVVSTKIEIT